MAGSVPLEAHLLVLMRQLADLKLSGSTVDPQSRLVG
jgi:hypothetical protein